MGRNPHAVAKVHVTDDTEQANPEEELKYAEAHMGRARLLYHGPAWQTEQPVFCVKVSITSKDDGIVYRNIDEISGDKAHKILKKMGGWDYTE
jgi:hypothetical protein